MRKNSNHDYYIIKKYFNILNFQTTYELHKSFRFLNPKKKDLPPEIKKLIIKNINSCLDRVHPFMKRKKEQIRFVIHEKKIKGIHTDDVIVHGKFKTRLRYYNFSTYYDCPTLIHELIHFYGLEDEYIKNKTECKISSMPDSLYIDHNESFRSIGIKLTWEDYTKFISGNCNWAQKNQNCIRYKTHYKKLINENFEMVPMDLRQKILNEYNTTNFKTKKTGLLYPVQFEALIKKPFETEMATNYFQCTGLRVRNKSCDQILKKCKTTNWLF